MPASKQPSRRQKRTAGLEQTVTPRKLNREVINQLRDVLEKGVYIETAAAYVGVHKDTFYDWLKTGRRHIQQHKRSLHRDLVEAVEHALAAFEVNGIDRLASEEHWTATAWRLERRFPDKYGRRQRVEHSGPDGKPIAMRIDVSKLSDDELAQLEGLLEKGRPADVGADRPADTGRGARRDQG